MTRFPHLFCSIYLAKHFELDYIGHRESNYITGESDYIGHRESNYITGESDYIGHRESNYITGECLVKN